MNDRDIISAFNDISAQADSGCVEKKVRENIKMKKKLTIRRPVKMAAVIAAVLVLVTVPAAAFGAVYHYVTKQIHGEFLVRDHNGNVEYRDGYTVLADGKFENVKLTDEKIKELEQYWYTPSARNIYDYGKIFESYAYLSEWLGCDVLSSDILGGKPSNMPFGGDIVLYTSGNEEVGVLEISIASSHTIHDSKKICNIQIGIPLYNVNSENMGWGSIGSEIISKQNFSAENGITAEIIESWRDTENVTFKDEAMKNNYKKADAYFINDGIMYHLSINGTADETIPLLKSIISSMK